MTININVDVRGPGLVVNCPVAILYKALSDAGYTVNMEEFSGQHQYIPKCDWPDKQIESLSRSDKSKLKDLTIKINVTPMPWGG